MSVTQEKQKQYIQSIYYALGIAAILFTLISGIVLGISSIKSNTSEIVENREEIDKIKKKQISSNELLMEIRFNLKNLMNANGQQYIENPPNAQK